MEFQGYIFCFNAAILLFFDLWWSVPSSCCAALCATCFTQCYLCMDMCVFFFIAAQDWDHKIFHHIDEKTEEIYGKLNHCVPQKQTFFWYFTV